MDYDISPAEVVRAAIAGANLHNRITSLVWAQHSIITTLGTDAFIGMLINATEDYGRTVVGDED